MPTWRPAALLSDAALPQAGGTVTNSSDLLCPELPTSENLNLPEEDVNASRFAPLIYIRGVGSLFFSF